jgi:CO/xanthine dehydrogenase FAD-binding subunit
LGSHTVNYLRPQSWSDAIAMKAELPDALPINGGTDVMVEINLHDRRPADLLDLTSVPEINGWSRHNGDIHIGAGVTYTQLIDELAADLPALAIASRTVGSPQIRNRGTIAGNLGSASPAGDAHPPLLATGASVVVESLRGRRSIPINEFFVGVKRTALEPDELINEIIVPAARGPQQFSKIGTRNAMVIAVISFAIAFDVERRSIGTGIGSAAPTPISAQPAEEYLATQLEASGHWDTRTPIPEPVVAEFARLVVDATSPIDDVRGTAAYRRHGLGVIAGRALRWAWNDLVGSSNLEAPDAG